MAVFRLLITVAVTGPALISSVKINGPMQQFHFFPVFPQPPFFA